MPGYGQVHASSVEPSAPLAHCYPHAVHSVSASSPGLSLDVQIDGDGPAFNFDAAVALAHEIAGHVDGRGADALLTRLRSIELLIVDADERRRFGSWRHNFARVLATRNVAEMLRRKEAGPTS